MRQPPAHPRPRAAARRAADRARARARARRAFTLVEILTVVIIIAVLMAIVLPMLASAMRNARKTRVAADMQTISVALGVYKDEFGDYPRPEPHTVADPPPPPIGFALLGKVMVAPAPGGGPVPALAAGATHAAGTIADAGAWGTPEYRQYVAYGLPDGTGGFSTTSAPPSTGWAVFFASDGKDGTGFRARPGGKTY